MKIYTKLVLQWNDDGSFTPLDEDSYEHDGAISECKGGGGGTSTVEKSDPWSGVQPYMVGGQQSKLVPKISYNTNPETGQSTPYVDYDTVTTGSNTPGLFSEAAKLYQNHTPTYFPGSTVVPFSNESEMAMGAQTRRAMYGSPVTQSAQDQNLATTRGDFLYGSPGFDAAYQAAANKIIPQVDSAFAGAGRYGSGLARTAQTQALGDAFAGLYNQERQRQQAASALAPTLAGQDYADINALSQVGAQREGYAGDLLAEQIARHEFQQNLPYEKLQQYASIVQPGLGIGGQRTSMSPLYRNRAAGALGGAASGAMIGSQIMPGWGTAIGAIGGGLLGSM
jgi:hypothetical protein